MRKRGEVGLRRKSGYLTLSENRVKCSATQAHSHTVRVNSKVPHLDTLTLSGSKVQCYTRALSHCASAQRGVTHARPLGLHRH
mmetsp:Transcript_8742/g.21977  ORF Transcript_8742/g.21977 Transcript_8742/m.21977 type:complete len:83 (-) Transcript_8742:1680-1928(-)